MKKEEILAASKKENKNKDLYEIQVELQATKYAALALVILSAIYFIYEIVSGKGMNLALYSQLAIFNAILYGVKAFKLEKNKKIHLTNMVIWSILTIMLIVEYFTGK